jgi:hypothetical protein
MGKGWRADPRRLADLVADRRRRREANPTVAECDLCPARGPWTAIDALTGWLLCGRCLVDLAKFRRELDRYGRPAVRG